MKQVGGDKLLPGVLLVFFLPFFLHLHARRPPAPFAGAADLIALLADTCLCFPATAANQDEGRPPPNKAGQTATVITPPELQGPGWTDGATWIKGEKKKKEAASV